jgi:hypothetical protein
MNPCKPMNFKPLDKCKKGFEQTRTVYLDAEKKFVYSDKELTQKIGHVVKSDNGKGYISYQFVMD